MIRTVYFDCDLPRSLADALNRESGRIYSRVMVEHDRIYRKHGLWLKAGQAEKLDDGYHAEEKRLLHAHSTDAAQQGFYKACQTARTNKGQAVAGARYPHKRKPYRTTVWKNTAIRYKSTVKQRGTEGADPPPDETALLQLSLARGLPAVEVNLPGHLAGLPLSAFVEVRLVYNKATHRYEWHVVLDDGLAAPAQPTAAGVMAGDMGEIHPIVLSTEQQAEVIACRELRAVRQQTNRVLASYQRAQSRCQKRSRKWHRLQRHKRRFLAKQEQRVRDLEHKISRAVVQVAQDQHIGLLVLGDVRNINQGKRLHTTSQQQISQWSHGQLRLFITYKATAAGIRLDTVNEAYTSRTMRHEVANR
jgi:putative transposase